MMQRTIKVGDVEVTVEGNRVEFSRLERGQDDGFFFDISSVEFLSIAEIFIEAAKEERCRS